MTKQTKQELACETILYIAGGLLRKGRNRKRPGKPRAEAMVGGTTVSYRSGFAESYSLAGAIKAAAYSMRREVPAATLSRARKQAESDVLLAIYEYQGGAHESLADADEKIADTRLIMRAIKKAQKWNAPNSSE